MPRPEYPQVDDYICRKESDITILNSAILEIKDTLRDLKDLLKANAVLEEQALQFRENITAHAARIHTLELEIAKQVGSGKWVDRIVWAILSAVISGVFVYTGLKV